MNKALSLAPHWETRVSLQPHSSLQRSPRARLYLHSSPRSPRRPLAVSPIAFLQDDVFDRLHINASSSFILKNTEKVELDDAAPFYVGVAPPNVARDM